MALEAFPRRLHGADFPQPVGVQLTGKVQPSVGGTQVGFAASAIGQAGDLDRTEDGRQWSGMAGLDTAPTDTVGVHDVVAALLTDRTQVQVVLEQQPDQLTHIDTQSLFELAVGEVPGLLLHRGMNRSARSGRGWR